MSFKVVEYPAKVLKKPAKRANKADQAELVELFVQMKETMFESSGIGLAAPQVGRSIRLFIAHDTVEGKTRAFVNPQIISASSETNIGSEGCLSFPGLYGDVERHLAIKLCYQDLELIQHEELFTGLVARVIQHELDHLNGVLLVDRAIDGLYSHEEEEEGDTTSAEESVEPVVSGGDE